MIRELITLAVLIGFIANILVWAQILGGTQW